MAISKKLLEKTAVYVVLMALFALAISICITYAHSHYLIMGFNFILVAAVYINTVVSNHDKRTSSMTISWGSYVIKILGMTYAIFYFFLLIQYPQPAFIGGLAALYVFLSIKEIIKIIIRSFKE